MDINVSFIIVTSMRHLEEVFFLGRGMRGQSYRITYSNVRITSERSMLQSARSVDWNKLMGMSIGGQRVITFGEGREELELIGGFRVSWIQSRPLNNTLSLPPNPSGIVSSSSQ